MYLYAKMSPDLMKDTGKVMFATAIPISAWLAQFQGTFVAISAILAGIYSTLKIIQMLRGKDKGD